MTERAEGVVYLVGAGPGDPQLLTLAAARCLEQADCVLYDKLVDPRILARAPAGAERIFAGKEAGNDHYRTPQEWINEVLISKARAGQTVVRLKGGDPLLFARGAEEAEALESAGVRYAIIPGVTAALGAAATASIPLTHRSHASSVVFVTGHEDPSKPSALDWDLLARLPGTLVVYMGLKRLAPIAAALLRHGRDPGTPVALVEWGGSNRQKVVTTTLSQAATEPVCGLVSPVLTIVGNVVGLRQRLGWFERRPLFGQTILVTRPLAQCQATVERLEGLGATTLCQPALAIQPPVSFDDLDEAIATLADHDWIVFTSANGVEAFFGRLLEVGKDLRWLGDRRLAAIGPGTAAALARYHLKADLIPHSYRAEALAEALGSFASQRFLLVRADRGREVLPEQLAAAGARVRSVVAYRQIDVEAPAADIVEAFKARTIDWILITSANGARGVARWLEACLEDPQRQAPKLASISPVTSEVVRRLGYAVAAEAKEYTLEGMIDAVVAAEGSKLSKGLDRLPDDQRAGDEHADIGDDAESSKEDA